MSLSDFCQRESLPYEATQKAFKRREKAGKACLPKKGACGQTTRISASAKWEALRLEFLGGDWESLADFARDRGLNGKSGYFSKMTKGWRDQKAEIEAKSKAENVAALADQAGAAAIASLHGRILTALYRCLGDLETNGPKRVGLHKSVDSVRDNVDFLRGVNLAIDGLLKVLPPVAKIEALVATRALLQEVLDQGLDVTEAAIRLDMLGVSLPESLKIILAKQEPPEPPEPEGHFPSDEELDAIYYERMERIAEQEKRFLPERRKEIEELKRACQTFDSFSDDAMGEPTERTKK